MNLDDTQVLFPLKNNKFYSARNANVFLYGISIAQLESGCKYFVKVLKKNCKKNKRFMLYNSRKPKKSILFLNLKKVEKTIA